MITLNSEKLNGLKIRDVSDNISGKNGVMIN